MKPDHPILSPKYLLDFPKREGQLQVEGSLESSNTGSTIKLTRLFEVIKILCALVSSTSCGYFMINISKYLNSGRKAQYVFHCYNFSCPEVSSDADISL